MEFFMQQKKKVSQHPDNQKTELDKYLGEDAEDMCGKFDILLWWKVSDFSLSELKVLFLFKSSVWVFLPAK